MIDIKPSPTKPGSFSVSMPIPDDVNRQFDAATLARKGVQIESGRVTLTYVKSGSGGLSLDRQFPINSYEGRFERTLDTRNSDVIEAAASLRMNSLRSSSQKKQGNQEDVFASIQKVKNSPELQPPQVSTEGPKRLERDDSEIAGFPDGTVEMKKLRSQPAKPVLHAPPPPKDPSPSYSAPLMK